MAIRVGAEQNEVRTLVDLVDLVDLTSQHVLEIGRSEGRLTWRFANSARSVWPHYDYHGGAPCYHMHCQQGRCRCS
jgi:hypothetical protein